MGFQVWTYKLTAGQSITIVGTMNLTNISYQMSSGTGDNGAIQGSFTLTDNNGSTYASQQLSIAAGGGNDVSSRAGKPIDGLIISCIQGTMDIIGGI